MDFSTSRWLDEQQVTQTSWCTKAGISSLHPDMCKQSSQNIRPQCFLPCIHTGLISVTHSTFTVNFSAVCTSLTVSRRRSLLYKHYSKVYPQWSLNFRPRIKAKISQRDPGKRSGSSKGFPSVQKNQKRNPVTFITASIHTTSQSLCSSDWVWSLPVSEKIFVAVWNWSLLASHPDISSWAH